MVGGLGELSVGGNKDDICSLVFPHGSIKKAYLASVLFVQLGVGRTHNGLKDGMVTEEATLFLCPKKRSAHK